ncbi:MAG TPA: polysaccharide pyruvyl transferase family protein [Bryobacteraceae bacterium]|nr:polysaccharide pyruvyl transferase family protein [Bryobacteraceae bacterium]
MTITILGAAFNNENLGVGALAVGIVTCIEEAAPDAEITLLDFAQEPEVFHLKLNGGTKTIRTVNLRMKPSSPANNIVFLVALALLMRLLPRRVRESLYAKNRVLDHIHNSDVIVSIAGGDSFSDIYGMRRLVDVSLPQMLVLLVGKELVLLPQTLGPFKSGIAKMAARTIMTRAKLVFSRDKASLQEAKAVMGGGALPAHMRFCPDLGIMMQPQRPEHLNIEGVSLGDRTPLVGLNISGLLYIGGYKRDDAFGFQDKYIKFSYQVIDWFIQEKNARVLLVPHCLGTGDESDSVACERLYEELKAKYPGMLGVVRGRYATAEMKYIIGQCDFFVGSRMHACIAALSQGIPAIAVAYSRKFIGVLDTLGAGELVVDPQKLSVDEMLRVIGEKYDNRGKIETLLASNVVDVRKTILNLFPEICSRAKDRVLKLTGTAA